MSILNKPYEISVWDDVWEGEKFVEKRIGVIGADEMSSQSRVFDPSLNTNVNGVKKLSFKLYKNYVDAITGKTVENPFYSWLVSERKVKLYYENEWYDFVIKQIKENSETSLCTYSLEDALVQELSKNGFNLVLDTELMNNSGTAAELASRVLAETDWEVANDSEAFVETLEEPLIYLQTTEDIEARQIIDQIDLQRGVTEANELVTIAAGTAVFGFYSSCATRPDRFQFVYIPDSEGAPACDENRVIINSNCQYYIDYLFPSTSYTDPEVVYGFILPKQFTLITSPSNGDSTISSLYRGRRYVYSQKTLFAPVLGRYVNVYQDEDAKEYYGYADSHYCSPALTFNTITNTQFKSTSGWTGTRTASETKTDKATVEAVYGYWGDDGVFVTSIDLLQKGEFDALATERCDPYLKVVFPQDGSGAVINSGPFDNRTLIKNMEVGEEWVLSASIYTSDGQEAEGISYTLGESVYDATYDAYIDKGEQGLKFKNFTNKKIDGIPYWSTTVEASPYSSETFKKNSQVRLKLAAAPGTYYIKSINLFKAVYDGSKLVTPAESAAKASAEGVVETFYYLFTPDKLEGLEVAEQLIPDKKLATLEGSGYRSVYTEGAQKIRTIAAKESNYFNILQSIAETFEGWLRLGIERDESGAIIKKAIQFKNYVGAENYAGFRYQVNLSNIERTYESKKIVSKLIVKDNSNEFAPNGFCSIARAKANPTGENYICDFQYFFNTGLMDTRAYLETVYVLDGAEGTDISPDHVGWNLKGYVPRIKKINVAIDAQNEILLNLAKDLTQYGAALEVAKAGYEAAVAGLEQVQQDFERLTGKAITAQIDSALAKRSDVKQLLTEYSTYKEQEKIQKAAKLRAEEDIGAVNEKYQTINDNLNALISYKQELNKLFFSRYARFIQEGTWINEEYVDNEKYYADALSVMYNSCYPQVAYKINVLDLSGLKDYQYFGYKLGDKTWVEDPEFFGEEYRAEVVITELTKNLDDPSADTISVQNFKNQFQDLFQRITATVQQAQYSAGSYQKAVALAEAGQARKQQFLTDALDATNARLTTAGQQSVSWGNDGITVKSTDSPCDALRMVGGAILLSKQDKNGQQKWTTAVTSDGVSASLVTAGVLNAGEVAIMDNNEPVFRWDAHGISAYQYDEAVTAEGVSAIGGINTKQFVRFDKHGVYGVSGRDGAIWAPTEEDGIDENATFALTWDGLKVANKKGVTLRIGDGAKSSPLDANGTATNTDLFAVADKTGEKIFAIKEDGSFVWTETTSPSVNYDSIWDAFNRINESSSADSGIYTFETADGLKGLAINASIIRTGILDASLIKAGAIRIAESAPEESKNPWEGAKFYADAAKGGSVYIGGWRVNEDSLVSGGNGEIALYSADQQDARSIAGQKSKEWRLALGENFGVTKDGTMYIQGGTFSGKLKAATGTFNGDISVGNSASETDPYCVITSDGNLRARDADFWNVDATGGTFTSITTQLMTAVGGSIKLGAWEITASDSAADDPKALGTVLACPKGSIETGALDVRGNAIVEGVLTIPRGFAYQGIAIQLSVSNGKGQIECDTLKATGGITINGAEVATKSEVESLVAEAVDKLKNSIK